MYSKFQENFDMFIRVLILYTFELHNLFYLWITLGLILKLFVVIVGLIILHFVFANDGLA